MTHAGAKQGPARPVAMQLARELAPLSLADWAAACTQALRSGQRMLSLFGRRDGEDQAVVTAVLLHDAGGMEILRGRSTLVGLALALRNNEISDFPICNKSFDLSTGTSEVVNGFLIAKRN